MSQNSEILEYLKQGNSLTSLQALGLFGCLRLASRVGDLKDMGYVVISEQVIDRQRKKRYSRYRLAMK